LTSAFAWKPMHGIAACRHAECQRDQFLRAWRPARRLAVAARPSSLKLFMTSGVLVLSDDKPVETDCVRSR
jgi:hypothetical protein